MFLEQNFQALLSAAGIGDVEVLQCLAAWHAMPSAPSPKEKVLNMGTYTT